MSAGAGVRDDGDDRSSVVRRRYIGRLGIPYLQPVRWKNVVHGGTRRAGHVEGGHRLVKGAAQLAPAAERLPVARHRLGPFGPRGPPGPHAA